MGREARKVRLGEHRYRAPTETLALGTVAASRGQKASSDSTCAMVARSDESAVSRARVQHAAAPSSRPRSTSTSASVHTAVE